MINSQSVLEIDNLSVAYPSSQGDVLAVQDISLRLNKGEMVGLVGESGSGKSTLAFAIMRLLKNGAHVASGQVRVNGMDIYQMDDEQLRRFRWKTIAMVFQSAMNALNPVLTIGEQIVDTITSHESVSHKEAFDRGQELLKMVRIDPLRMRSYPHELSGGMRQRVVIAIALALNPQVLIMDEPTTALDVVVQKTILDQIMELKERLGFSVLFISHDFSLVMEMVSRICVMYAGRLVEIADKNTLITRDHHHPYTQGLMRAVPRLTAEDIEILGIPGNPPDLRNLPAGCAYHPRCEFAKPICRVERPRTIVTPHHVVECHLFDENSEVEHG